MKKIVRLTESDLMRLVKRVLNEHDNPVSLSLSSSPKETWSKLKDFLKKQYGFKDYQDGYIYFGFMDYNERDMTSEIIYNPSSNRYIVWPCYGTRKENMSDRPSAQNFVGIFETMSYRPQKNSSFSSGPLQIGVSNESDFLKPIGIGQFSLNNIDVIIDTLTK